MRLLDASFVVSTMSKVQTTGRFWNDVLYKNLVHEDDPGMLPAACKSESGKSGKSLSDGPNDQLLLKKGVMESMISNMHSATFSVMISPHQDARHIVG